MAYGSYVGQCDSGSSDEWLHPLDFANPLQNLPSSKAIFGNLGRSLHRLASLVAKCSLRGTLIILKFADYGLGGEANVVARADSISISSELMQESCCETLLYLLDLLAR